MKKYWISFSLVIIISFAVLSWVGIRIYQEKPPIPEKYVTESGELVFTKSDIQQGQNIWQAMGGMQLGSIWGHGSYIAPDWTADWLHREAVIVLDIWSEQKYTLPFEKLSDEKKSALQTRLINSFRTNTYDPQAGIITIDNARLTAIKQNTEHYSNIFINGKDEYAIPKNSLTDNEKIRKLNAFFFWSSWAASTNRIDDNVTYTNNWPHEELVGNVPTPDTIVWTGVSIILLLLGIGGMALYYAANKGEVEHTRIPADDPLLGAFIYPIAESYS